jgi:hypothetical protein
MRTSTKEGYTGITAVRADSLGYECHQLKHSKAEELRSPYHDTNPFPRPREAMPSAARFATTWRPATGFTLASDMSCYQQRQVLAHPPAPVHTGYIAAR